jgi:hypothetical protein
VRMPFERLMEYAAAVPEEDRGFPMGVLAARVGESAERLADALTAVRVMRGERTYVSPVAIRAVDDPVVARALADDRGTIVSGFGVDTSQEG